MKNKVLRMGIFPMLVIILVILTGCSENENSTEQNYVAEVENPMIVSNVVTTNDTSMGTIVESNSEFIFTKEKKLKEVRIIGRITFNEQSKYTLEEYENQMNESIERTKENKANGMDVILEREGNDILKFTTIFDVAKVGQGTDEEYAEYKDMSYEEILNRLNENRSGYFYNPASPEKIIIPDNIEGSYVDNMEGVTSTDVTGETTYEFTNDTVLQLEGEERNEYPYEYEEGKLTIKKQNSDETYQVKSNYKGYDLVLLDENNNETFRGDRKD